MAENSSMVLTELDFNNLKQTLKNSLKSNDRFKDYDFDGSNISVLLDVMTYNSYLNTFYLNMVGSEMFMDSSELRDSAVSHAKDLNYLPRSFISAEAVVDLEFTSNDDSASLVIPKGSSFTGRNGSESFVFTTDKNILANRSGDKFVAKNVQLFEGAYLTESFVIDNSTESPRYVISNKSVDTRSVTVTVVEDNGSNAYEYLKARSLFGLTETSRVFFMQGASNDRYEIFFGDGVVSRQPKDNSVALIEYRVSKGELPNGINNFKMDSLPTGAATATITVVQPAAGGLIPESAASIKFNAPRAFTTQERAVTSEDYENLLKINFPEVNVVSAYGGEEAEPPQFGKVILAVDIKGFDGLPRAKESIYKQFLKERAPLSIDPVFVQPDFTYLAVDTLVRYNINLTGLSVTDIATLVVSSILEYKDEELDDFKTTARYSRLAGEIDASHSSIVSNETVVKAIKYIKPVFNRNTMYNTSYFQELVRPAWVASDTARDLTDMTLYSSPFVISNRTCYLMDDGAGNIRLVTLNDSGNYSKLMNVGTVDYKTGRVLISSLNINRLVESEVLKLYAKTKLKDISSNKNVILTINESDINVTVEQIRE